MSARTNALKRVVRSSVRRYAPLPQRASRIRGSWGGGEPDNDAIGLARRALAQTPEDDFLLLSRIEERIRRLAALASDPAAQAIERHRCQTDPIYFVDNYCWTYDPRLPQPYIPIMLFPLQREFVVWLTAREGAQEDGLAEKSRDAGATWVAVLFMLHRWLFKPGFKGAIGSRKKDLVDRLGDPDSIFEKLRIALMYLPVWLLPPGFRWRDHCRVLRIINPHTGASITGEAGDNIGRGGRASIYLIDEAAFLPRPERAEAALSNTSNVKIYVSTPNGMGNVFARKIFSKAFAIFTFHWRRDPRKNRYEVVGPDDTVLATGNGDAPPEHAALGLVRYPWYEAMRLKYEYEPTILAQEVDIDYSASLEGVIIPANWVAAAVELALEASGERIGAVDVAAGGSARTVLIIRHGPVIEQVYQWAKANTTVAAHRSAQLCELHGAGTLLYDAPGVGEGFTGTLRSSGRQYKLRAKGINTGDPPTKRRWPDGKTSQEKFNLLKAELWWALRLRFEKAYEYVEMGIEHPHSEMISIPKHYDLIRQLSQVLGEENNTGKLCVETKLQMRKRGVLSPDFAEALVLSLSPTGGSYTPAAGGVGPQDRALGGRVPGPDRLVA